MRRENGSALIVTVMILLLLGVVGISALDTVMRDQQVAGFQNRSTLALYAAEAGLARAKDEVRGNYSFSARLGAINTFNTISNPGVFGDPSLYPLGRPQYYADPDTSLGDPLEAMAPVNSPGGGGSNMRMGGASWGFNSPYKLRVVGKTSDGAEAKVESVVLARIPGGY